MITLAPILILGFILLLIAFYLTPIAVLNYVKTKKFSGAFDFSTVLKKAITGKYFVAWLVVIIVTGIVIAVLSFIPILGPAIAIFIMGVFLIVFTLTHAHVPFMDIMRNKGELVIMTYTLILNLSSIFGYVIYTGIGMEKTKIKKAEGS